MSSAVALSRPDESPTASGSARARIADDTAMLRTAAELTRDINVARPLIYWSDMLGSAALGYAGLAGAITLSGPAAFFSAAVAILMLYRAGSFIHELTHVRHRELPWFRLGWNVAVGIPLLIPSFMYEGVHNLHHARTRYGTADDPEYLPLALMRPWTLPLFVVSAALAPLALLVRFSILAPMSLVSKKLRAAVVARFSGLQINPSFRRRMPDGDLRKQWIWQEIATSIWAITQIALVALQIIPLRAFAIFLGVMSGTMLLNQLRTLVAHLWENDGAAMTVTAQYLDSVNVPPPALLPALWAPVGLRYHALHHLLPSLPYHSLGTAHRRMTAALEEASPYHRGNHTGLGALIGRIASSTMQGHAIPRS